MARPKKAKPNRADGRYEIKATVGYNYNGKPIRKSFYSYISLEDAIKKKNEYLIDKEAEKRTGIVENPQDITFAKWAYTWLEVYKKPNVSDNSYRDTYLNAVKNHIAPHFGTMRLIDIKPIDIQNFYNIKSKELSESMMHKLKICINAIFETAIDNDLCFKNPAKHAVVTSEVPKIEKHVYSDKEITTAKEYFKTAFPEAYLLLDIGLRRGELIGLQWTDIDFEHKTLSVNRSARRVRGQAKPELGPPKWNSYRTIPLSSETVSFLAELKNNSIYVFPHADNGLQSIDGFTSCLKTAMRHMQKIYPDMMILSAHELRHTCGTQHRRNGVDIYTIQKLMGHKDINITANTYVHDETEVTRAAAKIY